MSDNGIGISLPQGGEHRLIAEAATCLAGQFNINSGKIPINVIIGIRRIQYVSDSDLRLCLILRRFGSATGAKRKCHQKHN